MDKFGYTGPERFRPIGAWAYVGYSLLFCVPLVGLILLIVFSLSDANINRRSFARSFFCMALIGILITGLCFATMGPAFLSGVSRRVKVPETTVAASMPLFGGLFGGEEKAADTDFYALMDSYEAFFDEYISFMQKYTQSGAPASMLMDYGRMLARYTEVSEALDKIDEDTLSDAELAYYTEVTLRIEKKLLDASL